MTAAYHDAWAVAKTNGTPRRLLRQPSGATRNGRIDYI